MTAEEMLIAIVVMLKNGAACTNYLIPGRQYICCCLAGMQFPMHSIAPLVTGVTLKCYLRLLTIGGSSHATKTATLTIL